MEKSVFQCDYEFQLSRKDKLNTSANFSIGLGVICASILRFGYEETIFGSSYICLQSLFGVVSSMALSVFCYFVFKFYYGVAYTYMPLAKELNELKQKWESTHGHLKGKDSAEVGFNNQLESYYIKGASDNALANERRSTALY